MKYLRKLRLNSFKLTESCWEIIWLNLRVFRTCAGIIKCVCRICAGNIKWEFRVCAGIIKCIFRICAGNIKCVFRIYAGNIKWVFRICAGIIKCIFRICAGNIKCLFRICAGIIKCVSLLTTLIPMFYRACLQGRRPRAGTENPIILSEMRQVRPVLTAPWSSPWSQEKRTLIRQ